MEAITQQQWDAAKKDAAILEQKVAELVEAFEQKHKPIQVNILTRFRSIEDRYNLQKGGATQIKLHDRSVSPLQQSGNMDISISSLYANPISEVIYAEGMAD